MNEDILDQNLVIEEYKVYFKTRVVIIWTIAIIIGAFLRIMHWTGGSIILVTSSAGLHAYCLNGVLTSKERNLLNTTLSTLGLIWIAIMCEGIFSDYINLFSLEGFGMYCAILIVYFIIYYVQKRFMSKSLNRMKK